MSALPRLSVVGVTLVALVAVAQAPGVQAQPLRRATGSATVLYRSTFETTGLRGWHINGVWHAGSDGVAGLMGSNSGEILAPLSVAHLRNFRVTASIRAVGPPGPETYPNSQAYGLDLRATIWKSGIRGGSFLSYPYPGPNLGWSISRGQHSCLQLARSCTESPG